MKNMGCEVTIMPCVSVRVCVCVRISLPVPRSWNSRAIPLPTL